MESLLSVCILLATVLKQGQSDVNWPCNPKNITIAHFQTETRSSHLAAVMVVIHYLERNAALRLDCQAGLLTCW